MIYLDSSALVKLLFEESESAALAAWIARHAGIPLISSELAKVEVVRATRRLDATAVPAARALLSQLDLVPLTSRLINAAADVGEVLVRSLDAIHLASVLAVREDITEFVAYDDRLVNAAAAAGIPTVQPMN